MVAPVIFESVEYHENKLRDVAVLASENLFMASEDFRRRYPIAKTEEQFTRVFEDLYDLIELGNALMRLTAMGYYEMTDQEMEHVAHGLRMVDVVKRSPVQEAIIIGMYGDWAIDLMYPKIEEDE